MVNASAIPTDQILQCDCVDLMRSLPDGSIPLAVLDPPFGIDYKYDVFDDDLDTDQYIAWAETWLAELKRVVSPTGSCWIMIGPKHVSEIDVLAKRLGFHKRRHCIWAYGFGVNNTSNFTNASSHWLYYVADPKNFLFNVDAVRIPSSRQLVYNDKRANPNGRLPDDVWILRVSDADFPPDSEIWVESRICGTFGHRVDVPNHVPERVLSRPIRACSNPGDIVLDPFGGSFATAATAKKLGRHYISCDISEALVEKGRARLASVRVGDPLDTPISKEPCNDDRPRHRPRAVPSGPQAAGA